MMEVAQLYKANVAKYGVRDFVRRKCGLDQVVNLCRYVFWALYPLPKLWLTLTPPGLELLPREDVVVQEQPGLRFTERSHWLSKWWTSHQHHKPLHASRTLPFRNSYLLAFFVGSWSCCSSVLRISRTQEPRTNHCWNSWLAETWWTWTCRFS